MATKARSCVLLHNLAGYLVAVDDLSDAVKAAREAIGSDAARERDHVHVAIAIEHLALVFALRGDRATSGHARRLRRRRVPATRTQARVHRNDDARPARRLLQEGLVPDELARLMRRGRHTHTRRPRVALALRSTKRNRVAPASPTAFTLAIDPARS